jgi:hypothetical protein
MRLNQNGRRIVYKKTVYTAKPPTGTTPTRKKPMRKTLQASLLITVLAFPALAGDIQNGIAEPPPPPQSGQSMEEKTVTQETQTLTEITLNLLQSVLFLF